MIIQEQLIPVGHPNRPGTLLEEFRAIIFHYTANERPDATDTMNARYFGRAYVRKGSNVFERDSTTPFAYGSTQIIADSDSVTIAIPPTEAAWAAGDRHILPWTDMWRGQQHMSRKVFNCRPNYRSISIEICNNDTIKNSDADWLAATENAAQWAIDYLRSRDLKVDLTGSLDPQSAFPIDGKIIICRHYDVTGKICPKPFVDSTNAWNLFVRKIADAVGV